MANKECPCGIFRNDCEYHRPEPETVNGDIVVDTGPPKPAEYKWPASTVVVSATYYSSGFALRSVATW